MEDAETSLSSASMTPRGRLRVEVPSPMARMLLIPALPAFYARYPEIQLIMGVSDRIVDIIGENVDCVIRGGEIVDQSLVAQHVGDLKLGIYAAPSYLQRHIAKPHLASGELVALFEDWQMAPMPMYVAFPPNRHVSAQATRIYRLDNGVDG